MQTSNIYNAQAEYIGQIKPKPKNNVILEAQSKTFFPYK